MVDAASWPPLILVNGSSSAGKTTLCRALQKEIALPYLVGKRRPRPLVEGLAVSR